MQHLLVFIAVALAVVFIGRRLWRCWRHPGTTSCGCGCSGCDATSRCPDSKGSLPLYKS